MSFFFVSGIGDTKTTPFQTKNHKQNFQLSTFKTKNHGDRALLACTITTNKKKTRGRGRKRPPRGLKVMGAQKRRPTGGCPGIPNIFRPTWYFPLSMLSCRYASCIIHHSFIHLYVWILISMYSYNHKTVFYGRSSTLNTHRRMIRIDLYIINMQ